MNESLRLLQSVRNGGRVVPRAVSVAPADPGRPATSTTECAASTRERRRPKKQPATDDDSDSDSDVSACDAPVTARTRRRRTCADTPTAGIAVADMGDPRTQVYREIDVALLNLIAASSLNGRLQAIQVAATRAALYASALVGGESTADAASASLRLMIDGVREAARACGVPVGDRVDFCTFDKLQTSLMSVVYEIVAYEHGCVKAANQLGISPFVEPAPQSSLLVDTTLLTGRRHWSKRAYASV